MAGKLAEYRENERKVKEQNAKLKLNRFVRILRQYAKAL
jgi:hypothetical protein